MLRRHPAHDIVVIVSLLVAVAALVPTVAHAKAKPKPCRPSGSVAIAATPKVRVYTRESWEKGWEKLYACRYRDNRPIAIATTYPDSEAYPDTGWNDANVRIAGDYAAITVWKEYEDDQVDEYAVVVDTKRRRVVGRATVVDEQTRITDLVMDGNGNAAFLSQVHDLESGDLAQRRIDRLSAKTKKTSLVASDLAIKTGSLKLSGATLSWTQGAEKKTAPLF